MGTASSGEWIAILLYFALVIGVGVYFFFRDRNVEGEKLAAPRLLQGRQGSLEAESAIQVLLPLHSEVGEQQPQPLHQEAGAALLPRAALTRPGDDELLGGPGAETKT